MKVKMKRCTRCLKKYPATTEYFRRNSTEDGLDIYCKTCASEIIKNHFLYFTRRDLRMKGSHGVRCPLWAEQCEICEELATCWRIAKIKPGSDEYPEKLNELLEKD
jgi:hypothetical protein